MKQIVPAEAKGQKKERGWFRRVILDGYIRALPDEEATPKGGPSKPEKVGWCGRTFDAVEDFFEEKIGGCINAFCGWCWGGIVWVFTLGKKKKLFEDVEDTTKKGAEKK